MVGIAMVIGETHAYVKELQEAIKKFEEYLGALETAFNQHYGVAAAAVGAVFAFQNKWIAWLRKQQKAEGVYPVPDLVDMVESLAETNMSLLPILQLVPDIQEKFFPTPAPRGGGRQGNANQHNDGGGRSVNNTSLCQWITTIPSRTKQWVTNIWETAAAANMVLPIISGQPLCLKYHCLGVFRNDCDCRAWNRALNQSEEHQFRTYVQAVCPDLQLEC